MERQRNSGQVERLVSCFSFIGIASEIETSCITIVLLRIIVDKLSLVALELLHLGALEFV